MKQRREDRKQVGFLTTWYSGLNVRETLPRTKTFFNIWLSLLAYESFDLDDLCDDECKAEFRFMKNYIYQVKDILQVPDEIVCYNRLVVKGIEAFFKAVRIPHSLQWYVPSIWPVPQFSITTATMIDFIYNQHSHCLILACCHSYSFTVALPLAIFYASMVTTLQRITPYSTTASI